MKEQIPKDVREALEILEDAGQEAWCVGGCVRDLLLGRTPNDWDVTTDALPSETLALFGKRAVPTGLSHGTVTVRTEQRPVEVTTYRCDGPYADHRHPDCVTFSKTLKEDLRRRDFTVNAIALSLHGVLQDPFGGKEDLQQGILRCVGNPDQRFNEDALRILRGLRFAAVLGFDIEPDTAESIHRNRGLLRNIPAERIRVELEKLLCGQNAAAVLRANSDVISVFMPEIQPLIGFDQKNQHHCYDAWEHTLHSVEAVAPDPLLRMVLLLHDLGKPRRFTVDAYGVGHFCGHPVVSRELASDILRRLKYDNQSRETILTLVEWHDRNIPRTEKGIRRALRALGEKMLWQLLAVKRADNLAQAPKSRMETQTEIDRAERILHAVLKQNACVSLQQLAVNGRDLIAMGLTGSEIGRRLDSLLDAVVDGTLPNDRDALLTAARRD